jgi:WD40 repeat protein
MKIFLFIAVFFISLSVYSQTEPSRQDLIWSQKQDNVTDLKFSRDGHYVFLNKSENNNEIDVLEAITGKLIVKLTVCNFFVDFSISSDGRLLAVHCQKNGGRATEIWDVPNGKLMRTFSHDAADRFGLARLSPDGLRLITQDKSDKTDRPESAYYWSSVSSFYLWDVVSGKKIGILVPKTVRRGEDSYESAFSPDGSFVVTSYLTGQVSIWNADNGNLVQTLVDPAFDHYFGGMYAHSGRVSAFKFTSNNKKLITGGYDGSIKIWNIQSGNLEYSFPRQKGRIAKLAVSDDSRMLCSIDGLQTIKCWNLDKKELLKTIKFKESIALPIQWEATFLDDNNNFFARISSKDSGGVVFDLRTGIKIWESEKGLVAVSPNRKYFLLYKKKENLLDLSSFQVGHLTIR